MIILIVRVLAVAATLVLTHTSNCGLLSTHGSLSLRCIIVILILTLRFSTAGIALVVSFRCLGSFLDFNIGIMIII